MSLFFEKTANLYNLIYEYMRIYILDKMFVASYNERVSDQYMHYRKEC